MAASMAYNMAAILCILPLILATKAESNAKMTEAPTSKTSDDGDIALQIEAAMSECNVTFRIQMEYIISLSENASFPDETDKTPMCYVRCVLETMDVVSEDGTFDPARAAQVLTGSKSGKGVKDIDEIIAPCVLRNETCKCERAYNFMKCVKKALIMKNRNGQ